MKKKLLLFLLIGLAVSLAGMQPSQATVLTYNLDYEYSGGANPAGSPPWLVATFDDMGTPGSVRLTMDAAGLTDSSEFVTQWLFNVNINDPSLSGYPDLNEQDLLANLEFWYDDSAPPTGSTGPPENQIGINRTANSIDLDPASGFDIGFRFPTSNGQLDRFNASEKVVYDIISADYSITAFTFDASNLTDPNGPYSRTVAKVQGIDSFPGSGKIAENPNPVPEPATMLLVGLGLIGLAGLGRRRFKA